MGDPPAARSDASTTEASATDTTETASTTSSSTGRSTASNWNRGPPRTIGGTKQQGGQQHITRIANFSGHVSGINGDVFQLHSERRKRGQFRDTVEALKTLASTEFKQEVRYLEPLFRALEDPIVPLPIKPKEEEIQDPNDSTKTIKVAPEDVYMDVYKVELTEYVKQKERLRQTKSALVNIVIGQCSKPTKNKLKEMKGFEQREQNGDIAGILQAIRDLSNQIEKNVSPYETLDELHKQFFLYRHMPGEDNATHLTKFKELVDALEHNGSTIFKDGAHAILDSEIKKCTATARNKHLATCFLRRANMGLYGPFLRELRDQRLHGVDIYPQNMADACSLLENHIALQRGDMEAIEKTTKQGLKELYKAFSMHRKVKAANRADPL